MSAVNYIFIAFLAVAFVSPSHQICSNIDPPEHGDIKFHESYSYYEVSCDSGYIMVGKPTGFCHNDEWDNPLPKCVANEGGVCEKLSAPENGKIKCDDGPLTFGKSCSFECNDGYRLQGVKVKRCWLNFQWSGPSVKCVPTSITFCPLPPPLKHGSVDGCSHSNMPRPSQTCSFRCNGGYVLRGPASVTCTSTGKLIDGNGLENLPECVAEISSPERVNDNLLSERRNLYPQQQVKNDHGSRSSGVCYNHQCQQLCRNEGGRAQCRCDRGYTLHANQRNCTKSPCPALPIPENGKMKCNSLPPTVDTICDFSCSPGYSSQGPVRRKCVKKNEWSGTETKCIRNAPRPATADPVTCQINNGGCQHRCDVIWTTVQCSCRRGFVLHSDGKSCVDIDECLDENLNSCQHYCLNTEGSYTCNCKPGYVLIDGYRCEGCGKNSYWSFKLLGCVDCPKNSHTDSEGKTSVSDCVCDSGFVGNYGRGVKCEDINECLIDNFGCSDDCLNIPGSAYCRCSAGFMLDSDNKTCIDTDECSIKNGGCEGHCENLAGDFRCICPEGYEQSNKDRYSCDDVDECSDNNGGCEQICNNFRGGYYCSCENGYRLDSGLKNCSDIQCPALPVPLHSYMVCKKQGKKFTEVEDYYPIGTICTSKCNTGFKNTKDSNGMECQEDGKWNGDLSECKSQSCPPLKVPENGVVRPPYCSRRGTTVKQKCTFACNQGYRLKGETVFVCRNNLTWNVDEEPVCQPVKIQPRIECPRDVTATLLLRKNTHNITLPEPTTNVESYEVKPLWVTVGAPVEFPAGVTEVTFSAAFTNSNKTAKCVTIVTVLDKEPPTFEYCPVPIQIEGASVDGELVTWEEPVVTDNVEVESVFSILVPNTTLTPGTHVVEYIARDLSGNTASCSFDISITRMNCSELDDPAHGEANCVDWMFGKFCQPQCDAGYMRNPDDPLYYSCDDTGIWEPSDKISECLQYTNATTSTCPDGFELKTSDETQEEICVECPSNTVWSAATRKCE